ncbi:MAG TPA: DNA-binding response regulator [Propionibacteriaceae bacterium]|nr:response regulator transcription factor [Micropruina sp.]HBX82418.1 DNA-binding response regulator [Propionibacteriaceae bacterium]HBY21909.1 DNA-binding response regulator [Propionibacteriaceae bacterium]
MMARIIVAEDDQKQAELLRSYLVREGHLVAVVHDGVSALEEIRARKPDLVLLDVMMPRMDGLDVCRVIRSEQIPTAVIMVTARVGDDDQITGLDLGADDYVTKPYSMRQLLARVRAALRRAGLASPAVIVTVDGLHIDRERCEVRVDGHTVELTPRELSILEALAARPGRVFGRQQLMEEAAGFDHYALDRTVDMHVVNLRRKIEADPANPRYVLTVKGRGYKLAEPERAD